jgi:hypothetical protein
MPIRTSSEAFLYASLTNCGTPPNTGALEGVEAVPGVESPEGAEPFPAVEAHPANKSGNPAAKTIRKNFFIFFSLQ